MLKTTFTVESNCGQIDLVFQIQDYVYIMEFKTERLSVYFNGIRNYNRFYACFRIFTLIVCCQVLV